jgi:hypothetical protein
MAIFDKDGNGVLDKEEMKEFKATWKNLTASKGTASGTAANVAGSGGSIDANSGAPVSNQDNTAGQGTSGCGGPGGFCCCRCGCPKGGR